MVRSALNVPASSSKLSVERTVAGSHVNAPVQQGELVQSTAVQVSGIFSQIMLVGSSAVQSSAAPAAPAVPVEFEAPPAPSGSPPAPALATPVVPASPVPATPAVPLPDTTTVELQASVNTEQISQR